MADVAQFSGMIGPANLVALVRNTAPFLFTGLSTGQADSAASAPPADVLSAAAEPRGWLRILRAAEQPDFSPSRDDYFALCLACHHATVATYIPTDVDAKIRGVLWQQGMGTGSLKRRVAFTLAARGWDICGVSARAVALPRERPVSGHDGEYLSVLTGALAALAHKGDEPGAAAVAAAIDEELAREARIFNATLRTDGAELDAARLAAVLTHNVGDLDQGISFWAPDDAAVAAHRARFARLAHENISPHGGAFQLAARIYKVTLAAEGHRNYPLRAVKPLRASADLLLPMAPFLDEWGGIVATHAALDEDDRAEVAAALIAGCRKIPGQAGYYRALAGIVARLDGPLERLAKRLPGAERRAFEEPEMRRMLAVKQGSFESAIRKRVAGFRA